MALAGIRTPAAEFAFHIKYHYTMDPLTLNIWNLLLELGKVLKQKWHKTTKNDMIKLTYLKVLWKYLSSIRAITACHFLSIKKICTKNLNLTICLEFRIIQFTIQEMTLDFSQNKAQAIKKVNNWILQHD